jgi:hypothetical protein
VIMLALARIGIGQGAGGGLAISQHDGPRRASNIP